MRAFYILVVASLLIGCRSSSSLDQGDFNDFLQRASHSRKQTGDFGAFFIQQIARYGGQVVGSTTPEELKGACYSESDHDGFAVQLYDIPFSQVQSLMQQAYGNPVDLYTNAIPNGLTGIYGIPHGVAVQFFTNTNGVGFICMQSHKK
jgi:hypothetical protein